jgi:superfamily II DNA or RNA helicase
MKLYPHQQRFLDNPLNDHYLLTWETQTGKTFAAKLWLQQKERFTEAIIVCPKQIREQWKEDAPFAKVYSFEDFNKATDLPKNPTAVVLDEIDCLCSPLFIAKLRSSRTEKMYTYLMDNPQAHVLGLSATPVRSTPWNMHTALVFTQKLSPSKWKEYQQRYFALTYKPYLPRPAWLPIPSWRTDMQELINKYTSVALRGDIVDLPPETHTIIKLKEPKYEQNEEWEAAKQFAEDHRLEQDKKDKEIKKISKGYRKAVVVAHYTAQIDALLRSLSKERTTFVLDGRTKDVHRVIKDAEADPECYFIIQASVGAGFSLPSFNCMIFASQGYSVRNYIQMTGRLKQITHPRPLIYYYLQAGRCDRMVYKSIEEGKTFIPSCYLAT